jgi:hypothetical protein
MSRAAGVAREQLHHPEAVFTGRSVGARPRGADLRPVSQARLTVFFGVVRIPTRRDHTRSASANRTPWRARVMG